VSDLGDEAVLRPQLALKVSAKAAGLDQFCFKMDANQRMRLDLGDQLAQVRLGIASLPQPAAQLPGSLDQVHRKALPGQRQRCVHPGHAAADDERSFLHR